MSATGHHHITDSSPWECWTVTVNSLVDVNAAVATARFRTQNRERPYVTATGSAKRMPEDHRNDVVGEQLAIGRALVSLGQYLIDSTESAQDD
jgi:Domain of unknown function (DUF1876)